MLYQYIWTEIWQYVNQNNCVMLMMYFRKGIRKYNKNGKLYRIYNGDTIVKIVYAFVNNYILSVTTIDLLNYNIHTIASKLGCTIHKYSNNLNMIKKINNIIERRIELFEYFVNNFNIRICKYLMITNDQWYTGASSACKYNNIKLLKITMNTVHNHIPYDINEWFVDACKNGYIKIIKYLIPKINDHTNGIRKACKYCHKDVIEYFISYQPTYIDMCFGYLCEYDKTDLVGYFINKVTNMDILFNSIKSSYSQHKLFNDLLIRRINELMIKSNYNL